MADLQNVARASIETEHDWRVNAEMWEDYYYGNQFSTEKRRQLERDGLPCIVINEIQPAVDRILGEEEIINFEWMLSSFENTDNTTRQIYQAIFKHIAEHAGLQYESSDWFGDGVITGRGFIMPYVDQKDGDDDIDIYFDAIPWYECRTDPNWRKYDYSDARVFFRARWLTEKAFKKAFPGEEAWFDAEIATQDQLFSDDEEVIDDKRNQDLMDFDYQNKKVRTWEAWELREVDGKDQLWVTVFIGEKELKSSRKKWFVKYDEDGNELPDSEYNENDYMDFISVVPYVIRWHKKEAMWYGLVSNAITNQDEVNLRHIKALHAMDTARVVMDKGAADPEVVAAEAARPDMVLEKKPGADITITPNPGTTQGQFSMMQDARQRLRTGLGLNAEYMGEQTNAVSGRAIQARQGESQKIQGRIFGNARRSQKLLGKMVMRFVGKVYTEERILRITNDDFIPSEVTINEVGPDGHIHYGLAANKYDITLKQVPASSDAKAAQVELVGKLGQTGMIPGPIAAKVVLKNSDIDDKEQVIQEIAQLQQQMMQPSPDAVAKAEKDKADAQLKLANIEKVQAETMQIMAEIRQFMQEQRAQGAQVAALERANADPATRYEVAAEAGNNGSS